jgi:hypothetical protein
VHLRAFAPRLVEQLLDPLTRGRSLDGTWLRRRLFVLLVIGTAYEPGLCRCRFAVVSHAMPSIEAAIWFSVLVPALGVEAGYLSDPLPSGPE